MIAEINRASHAMFKNGQVREALQHYYTNMIKFKPNLDEEWRHGDARDQSLFHKLCGMFYICVVSSGT